MLKFCEYSETNKPKYLVVLMHGYGANGDNLIDLGREFQKSLPEAVFIAPNACEPWEGGFPGSYQWFSLSEGFKDGFMERMASNIKQSNIILQNFIDQQLSNHNLGHENLFLVGFSQGAMMAIYQSLITKIKIAGVVAYSGKVVIPEAIGERTLSKPEICLIHGENDSVVPFDNFKEGKKILDSNAVPYQDHSFSNLDHSIDIRGVDAANKFFTKIIQGK